MGKAPPSWRPPPNMKTFNLGRRFFRRVGAIHHLAVLFLALAVASCATPRLRLPIHPNGEALWRIIHEQCVPDQHDHNQPAPCAVVSIAEGEDNGFVVLKDRNGPAQYLLMPTAKITGIEDPALLESTATNYFARAWEMRNLVEARLGRPLGELQIAIAVNSAFGRSQDQLHLHIDCLDRDVGVALRQANIATTGAWTDHAIELKGHQYHARWLDAAALATTSPFQLLADTIPGARAEMGRWTIALIGARGRDGSPGFYVLVGRANPALRDNGAAEELQDHRCQR